MMATVDSSKGVSPKRLPVIFKDIRSSHTHLFTLASPLSRHDHHDRVSIGIGNSHSHRRMAFPYDNDSLQREDIVHRETRRFVFYFSKSSFGRVIFKRDVDPRRVIVALLLMHVPLFFKILVTFQRHWMMGYSLGSIRVSVTNPEADASATALNTTVAHLSPVCYKPCAVRSS